MIEKQIETASNFKILGSPKRDLEGLYQFLSEAIDFDLKLNKAYLALVKFQDEQEISGARVPRVSIF